MVVVKMVKGAVVNPLYYYTLCMFHCRLPGQGLVWHCLKKLDEDSALYFINVTYSL
jgi:hypothetical protein